MQSVTKNVWKWILSVLGAARYVLNRYHNTSSVTSMLDILGWETLEQRRKTARLVAFFKMRTDFTHCEWLKAQLEPAKKRTRRKGNAQYYIPLACSAQYRAQSFLPRTIPEWNALPQEVVEAKTPDTFVSRLCRLHKYVLSLLCCMDGFFLFFFY